MNSETIAAPATPYGFGGIAVVRLSGQSAVEICLKLLKNSGIDMVLKHQTAVVAKIFDQNDNQIDEVVCTHFKGPNSYTGEDVVEISCHGNPVIVDRIVSACVGHGARIADPGEFTRRAFLNGKIDLIQAESVASLIHSKSTESSSLNLRLLAGELSRNLSTIQNELIRIASLVEFEIDISEDELQPNLSEGLISSSLEIIKRIKQLSESYKQARMLNRGALVVIVGKPNVGKSTLLNALSDSDRAITSDVPGTTRDAVDVSLIMNGVPINLFDTAGIRVSDEEIEAEGVRRSINYMHNADLIIFLGEYSDSGDPSISLPENIPTIRAINKIDLLDKGEKLLEKGDRLYLSAKTGKGIQRLREQIKDALGISGNISDTLSVTTNRQFQSLNNCKNNIEEAVSLLDKPEVAYELVSIEIQEALNNIGIILGKTTPDDILNNIFNRFCVGK